MPREWHREYEKTYYARPEIKAHRAEHFHRASCFGRKWPCDGFAERII